MKRLAKLGLALGALAALAAAAVAVWLVSLDVSQYRGSLERAALEATGRKLELAGPMDLRLGLRPTLVVEDARLANAAWGSRPGMASVRRLEIEVGLLALLGGRIRVKRLVLVEPDVLLETDAAGNANWTMAGAPRTDAAVPASPARAPDAPRGAALAFVEELRLERATLVYADGKAGTRQAVSLDELTLEGGSPGELVEISARGAWQENSFDVSGRLGPPAALGVPGRAFAVEVAGTVAPFGEVSLSTRVTGDPSRTLRLEDLGLRAGESEIAGRVEVALGGARPAVTATIRAERLEAPGRGSDPSPDHVGREPRGTRVFSSRPLPFAALRGADAAIDLEVKELRVGSEPVRDLAAKARLEGGALRIEPFGFHFATSRVSGRLVLDASGETPSLELDLDAPAVPLDVLLDEAARRHLREGKADLALRLRGRGRSVAEVASTLDGEARLLVGETRAKTDLLDVAVGGSSRVLGMLFAERTEWSTIRCAASYLRFERGVLTPDVLLVDTEYSTIVGEGEIDLGRETLDLTVSPQPKEVTLSVAVPIRVGGTLASPTYRPDEIAAAKKLGGLLSIAFFPPAALASLAELGSAQNPCLILAAGGRPPAERGLTGAARDAGETIVSGAGAGARKIGEGLKGLFGNRD